MEVPPRFLTLKELAMLKVAVHIANEKLGPYANFPDSVWDGRYPSYNFSFKFRKIVDSLEMPVCLKPGLCDVITGVFEQLRIWLLGSRKCEPDSSVKKYFPDFKELEIVFDYGGHLNESAIWGRYFHTKMALANDVESQLDLLELAMFHQLLPHIDTLLHKILNLCDGTSKTRLEGPVYAVIERRKLTMTYTFAKKPSQSISQNLHSAFCRRNLNSICVSETSVVVEFLFDVCNLRRISIQSIEEYCKLRGPPKRFALCGGLFLCTDRANLLVHFFYCVNDTMLKKIQAFYKRYNLFLYALCPFLEWPFAPLFFLLLNRWISILSISDYILLFDAIVQRMPQKVEYGMLYSNVLWEFWNMIPACHKTEFSKMFGNVMTRKKRRAEYNHEFMTSLDNLRPKNRLLHQEFVQELLSVQE